MEWWKTLNTVDLIALTKALTAQNASEWVIRSQVYDFITAHRVAETTQSLLEWLLR